MPGDSKVPVPGMRGESSLGDSFSSALSDGVAVILRDAYEGKGYRAHCIVRSAIWCRHSTTYCTFGNLSGEVETRQANLIRRTGVNVEKM